MKIEIVIFSSKNVIIDKIPQEMLVELLEEYLKGSTAAQVTLNWREVR